MPDPNIEHAQHLAAQYREAEAELKRAKHQLWAYVKALKDEGYSYSQLVAATGLAHGTVQNFALDYPYK